MRSESSAVVAAARCFSPGVLTKLAKSGDTRDLSALCRAAGIRSSLSNVCTVGEAFDAAFNLLKLRGARSEYVYKAALMHNVLLGVHSLSSASMVSEFRAGSSKADVVIFNGTSTVYEIKSERDNLSRLEGQIRDYRKVFARVFVICAPGHTPAVERILPPDVGILTLSRWNRISTVREAQDRASELCTASIFASLTNAEAKNVLGLCHAEIPDVPNTRLRKELKRQFQELEADKVHRAVVQTLRRSRSAESLKAVLHNLPKSVMPAALSLQLKLADRERFIEVMHRPLDF